MTEATAKKMEMVKNLIAHGTTVKNAARKAKIDLGHYYRTKKKMGGKKIICISFMGMDITGEPNVVKEFMIKFMTEYRSPLPQEKND